MAKHTLTLIVGARGWKYQVASCRDRCRNPAKVKKKKLQPCMDFLIITSISAQTSNIQH